VKALALVILALLVSGAAHADNTTIDSGRFGRVTIYRPQKSPASVALFVSGDGGWGRGVVGMASALADARALVIGVDLRHYAQSLAGAAASCAPLAVDFENLSQDVQKKIGLPSYHVPILVGYSSGATLVYATLAQAVEGTFAGALSLGFCPDLQLPVPPCRGTSLTYTSARKGRYVFGPAAALGEPWVAVQGQKDLVCSATTVDEFARSIPRAEVVKLPLVGHGFSVERNWLPQFRAAYEKLAASATSIEVTSPAVRDLPLTEVPASSRGETLALLLTGDGGWAGLDRRLSATLAARGVPVVGMSSLSYFWHEQSPERAAADVARALQHYLATWKRSRVLLIGYSFGADVLPFVVNRLPDDLRARLESVSLLGPGTHAVFEVHLPAWLGGPRDGGVEIAPELDRMRRERVLCIYGEGEKDSLCPLLGGVTIAKVGRGHHFSGDADALADRIIGFASGGRETGASLASTVQPVSRG